MCIFHSPIVHSGLAMEIIGTTWGAFDDFSGRKCLP